MLLFLFSLTPFIGMLIVVAFANRVEPYILGFPNLLFWYFSMVLLTPVVLYIVNKLDPANKREEAE